MSESISAVVPLLVIDLIQQAQVGFHDLFERMTWKSYSCVLCVIPSQ